MKTNTTAVVRIYNRQERVLGKETGRTLYVCECLEFNPFSAVIGRGYTPDEAETDFKFRASNESYAKNYNLTVKVCTQIGVNNYVAF